MEQNASQMSLSDDKLQSIFTVGVNLFHDIALTPNSKIPHVQAKVQKCIKIFENSTILVNLYRMFCENEKITDLPTNNLQYLLLPYYLGHLTGRILNSGRRECNIYLSKIYYKEFIESCEEYKLKSPKWVCKNEININVNNTARYGDISQQSESRTFIQCNLSRVVKMEQHRLMLELKQCLVRMKEAIKSQDTTVGDQIRRDYYIKFLTYGIVKAKEDICYLNQELQLIKFKKIQIPCTFVANTRTWKIANTKTKQNTKVTLKPIFIQRCADTPKNTIMEYSSAHNLTTGSSGGNGKNHNSNKNDDNILVIGGKHARTSQCQSERIERPKVWHSPAQNHRYLNGNCNNNSTGKCDDENNDNLVVKRRRFRIRSKL